MMETSKHQPQSQAPRRPKKSITYPRRIFLCLCSAAKSGALNKSDPEAVIRVAANLLEGDAAHRGAALPIDEVFKFAERYNLPLTKDRIEEVVAAYSGDGWLTGEDIGQLLNISVSDQEAYKLWLIGVRGETKADQKRRTFERQARKKADMEAKRAAANGPYHVNISAIAREYFLSRPTVSKLRDAWIEARISGGFDANFYSFVEASISKKNTILIGGKRYKLSDLMKKLDCSESTIRRWAKIPGTIETKLARGRGPKPARAAVSTYRSDKQRVTRVADDNGETFTSDAKTRRAA